MIAQWAAGLNRKVREQGCLLLCYLWVGWLYAMADRGRAGYLMDNCLYPTAETVEESYESLRQNGCIDVDCFVRDPERVVQFPWHYWKGCLHVGDDDPRVTVEKILPLHRGHVWPLAAAGDGRVLPPMNAMVVDVTRWQHGPVSHFTAICQRPAGYFDPWVVSATAQAGTPRSVRRVTLVPR